MPYAFMPNVYGHKYWQDGDLKTRDSHPQDHIIRFHNAYGHQTCKCGDMPLEALTNQAPWSFSHVVLLRHVTNYCWLREKVENASR